jgi:uncharacterized protein YkwD
MFKAGRFIFAIVFAFSTPKCHAQSVWQPKQLEQIDLKRTLVAQARTSDGKTTILLLIPTWKQEQVIIEEKTITLSKPQTQKRVDLPIDNVKAWTLNGHQLDDITIADMLRDPKHVLALPEGVRQYTPDPYYATILQPKTIVLAVSKTAFPASEKVTRPAAVANRNSPNSVAMDENIVIDQTNKERAKAGLPPLKRNEQLMESARKHSRNMAAKRILSHELGGTNFLTRSEAEGYQFAGGGENIAEGARSSIEVVSMWMQSPGHRSNILDANYTEIGVGFAFDANGRRFDTQIFGRPTPNSSVD